MLHGIFESKNNLITITFVSLMLLCGCKESTQNNVDGTTEVETIIEHKTNIRFATKTDGYKEHSEYKRLATNNNKITSAQFQMEGPAWENENVGFRNYFDNRNGMDIFGKTTTSMVLDSVGIDEDYHKLQEWGMDILKVGNSLGAGAIGLVIGDSLYNVGVGSEGSFKIIEETPMSSALMFTFNNWKVQDRNYNVSHTVTIKSGTHYYEGNVKIEGLKGDESIVAGIVDHGVGSNEIKTEKHTILSTHGNQEVEGLTLGMAIAVDNANYKKSDKASVYKGSVDKTHLVHLNGNNATYKFFAGWELQDDKFKSKEQFEKLIVEELE